MKLSKKDMIAKKRKIEKKLKAAYAAFKKKPSKILHHTIDVLREKRGRYS